jgi:hypothetical protein
LEEIVIQLQYPIIIKFYNVGAIYLANNYRNSQRTKHLDTRRHFVREWVEDDILKIIFTPTLHNTADNFTKNTTEEIFQTHAVKLVKPIPNEVEMCHFTSANYEDLVLEKEQNYGIVVAKRKQNSKQVEKLLTAKQEGKLKPPPYKLKPPLSTPKQQIKDMFAWEKKPLATCKCSGVKGHVPNDCYSRQRADKIQWRQIPYHDPGDKPLTWKEQQCICRMEDRFEEKAL